MIRYRPRDILLSLIVTIIFLVILEIISSTVIPGLGLLQFKLAFHMLIVIYLGFKFDSPWLPLVVLVLQSVHALFSIEGWALGTFSGVVVCSLIHFVKEVVQISSKAMTILLVGAFQLVWFLVVTLVICTKLQDFSSLFDRFLHFLPEGVLLSLVSPLIFFIMSKIWGEEEEMRV